MALMQLIVLLLPVFTVAHIGFPLYNVESEKQLRTWINDSHAREAFLDIWDGTLPALGKAYEKTIQRRDHRVSLRCLNHVNYLLNSGSPLTYNMLDSSVKFPESILQFSWTRFGIWDECVGQRDIKADIGIFNGQMCMVKLYPTLVGTSAFEDLQRANNLAGQFELLQSFISFRMGECVPSTCNANDVQELFSSIAANLPSVNDVKLTAMVQPSDCTTLEKPKLDVSDWVAVGILAALGAVVVLSTTYDVLVPTNRRSPVLAAFSITSNTQKLLSAPRRPPDSTLSSVYGIRCLSMAWVVLGHRYMFGAQYNVINNQFTSNVLSKWYYVGITNATVSVDTFLVLSGLLVGYLFFKQVPSKRKLNIPLYYVHRYIRLTPALAMMVLLNATLLFRLGWGPLWTETAASNREACRKYWWGALLYIQNYLDPHQCVSQSWYLMVDTQLYVLTPIFLYLLNKKPRIGVIFVSSLCVASLVANFVYSYQTELPGSSTAVATQKERNRYQMNFYFPTYTRFVPYLEGLLLGYFMGKQRLHGIKPRKLGFIFGCVAWLLVAGLLLVPLFTGININQYPGIDNLPTAFYNALQRPAWGLGIVLLVYLCATDNAGPVNVFLSWSGFQFLSRFSYGVYLVHINLQLVGQGTQKTIGYISDATLLAQFTGEIMISLFLAWLLSVLCESPFIVLEKELLGKFQKREKIENIEKDNTSRLGLESNSGEIKSIKTT